MLSTRSVGILGLNTRQAVTVCTAMLIVGIGAYSIVTLIETQYQTTLKNSLSTVLEINADGVDHWKDDQYLMVQLLAQSESIRDAAKALLAVPRNQEALLAADAQRQLRRLMKPYLKYYRGYFIIAPDHISLASSRDSNTGTPNLLTKYPDILARFWNGETSFTPLQRSDVPLSTEIERLPQPGDETLFVGTPLRDEEGAVIALFTLRIDPYKMLFPIIARGWLGETGESFIFDRYGGMLSNSRFDDQLVEIGLLEPGQMSAANLSLRDPGVDLTRSGRHQPLADDLPLTRMAASAVKGEEGADVTGYRDYRGVPVIGVWHWDHELSIGLATEMDVAEAYQLFNFVRQLIYGGSALASLALLTLGSVFVSGRRRVAQLQTRLQAVVETANDGIVVIDERGIVESVNPAMEAMFGYAAAELMGNSVNRLIPEPHRSRHDGYLERYRRTGVRKVIGVRQEVEGQRKDRTVFPLELSVNELEISGKCYYSGIVHDISERKEAEQAILKAREEAIAANRAKSTFLATMSHEIRTPLNGVVGTIDMLARTSLEPSQQDLVSTAQDSAVLLQGIIDDILDFSKIEAGKLELEQVPLVLESLVEALGENLRHIARDRQVELLLYVDPGLPQIKGDPVRLRQILYNLTGNAIKFSSGLSDRTGRVVLSVLGDGRKEGKAALRFRVGDNGIGMSPEVQKRLFRPFVQGEEETTRRFGGTGLGLVITQRLVEMMEGVIELESTEGAGSVFTVHVELEEMAESGGVKTSDLDGVKVVLLAEGEAARILAGYLQYAGADILSTNADDIVEICEKKCTGDNYVVIVDSRGDRELSTALCGTLRDKLHDIEPRFLLIERGVRQYARPYEADGMRLDLNAMRRKTFLNAVAALVGRESPEQARPAPLQPVPEAPVSLEEARRLGYLVLLVDDNQTNRKVISQQLQMVGYRAELAEDGAEALEMWRRGGYGLVLTDCHMPVMDGYELSAAIRREEAEGCHVPILAITADALKGTAQKCLEAGMDDYLTKPLRLDQLREAMEKWLPEKRAAEGAAPETATAETEEGVFEVVDPHALANLLGLQECGILADYYTDFLESNGPTAEQIEAAFRENDLSAVGSLAHKLKSSARTVGANALADCCSALERAGKTGDVEAAGRQMTQFPGLFRSVREWIEDYCRTE